MNRKIYKIAYTAVSTAYSSTTQVYTNPSKFYKGATNISLVPSEIYKDVAKIASVPKHRKVKKYPYKSHVKED